MGPFGTASQHLRPRPAGLLERELPLPHRETCGMIAGMNLMPSTPLQSLVIVAWRRADYMVHDIARARPWPTRLQAFPVAPRPGPPRGRPRPFRSAAPPPARADGAGASAAGGSVARRAGDGTTLATWHTRATPSAPRSRLAPLPPATRSRPVPGTCAGSSVGKRRAEGFARQPRRVRDKAHRMVRAAQCEDFQLLLRRPVRLEPREDRVRHAACAA